MKNQQKENNSEISAHGIYRSVKLFLQPVKLCKISKMLNQCHMQHLLVPVNFQQFMKSQVAGRDCVKECFFLRNKIQRAKCMDILINYVCDGGRGGILFSHPSFFVCDALIIP